MRISDIAEAAGCSVRAIRHYHASGAVPEPPRSSNGYRDYGIRDLAAVLRARSLVAAGVALHEIKPDPSPEAYDRALARIDARIDALQEQRHRLLLLKDNDLGMPADLREELLAVLGDDELAHAEVEAWELMAFTDIATAATWGQLRSNLRDTELRAESLEIRRLWDQLGQTPPGEASPLLNDWIRLQGRGIMTGIIDTLRSGSTNLTPTDASTQGAQLLAIEAWVNAR